MSKRICETCKHQGVMYGISPCGADCIVEYYGSGNHSNWEPKEPKDVKETPLSEKLCNDCEHWAVSSGDEPCNSCKLKNNWESNVKETPWLEKFCHNCEHWTVYKDDKPCVSCNDYEKWVRKAKEVKEAKEPIKEKPLPGYQNWYINFEIDKQLKELRELIDTKVGKICNTCRYNKPNKDCPDECFEGDMMQNVSWLSRDSGEDLVNVELKINTKLSKLETKVNNVESNQTILLGRVNLLAEDGDDFEVEVKAALSDMEKSLLRLQSRLDEQTKWLDSIHFENFAHRDTKPDPKLEVQRICSTCEFEKVMYGTPPCGAECLAEYCGLNHSNWKPKTEGCQCLD